MCSSRRALPAGNQRCEAVFLDEIEHFGFVSLGERLGNVQHRKAWDWGSESLDIAAGRAVYNEPGLGDERRDRE